jgi:LacI family transcriptional regulator
MAGKRGYVTATGCNITDTGEAALTAGFLKQHVCGVILAPYLQHSTVHYRELIEGGIPVVLIDGIILDHVEDAVLIDNQAGMRLAVQHLAKLGRRRIAYIGHNLTENIPNQPGRRGGYLAVCAEMGLGNDPRCIIERSEEDYRDQLMELLRSENRPDAFIAYNDAWAIRVIRAARELGLRVPQDISVVGFDNSSMATEYDIPLTTVEPQHREMGIAAVEILVDIIENPRPRPKRTVLLQPQLIVRNSTALSGQ